MQTPFQNVLPLLDLQAQNLGDSPLARETPVEQDSLWCLLRNFEVGEKQDFEGEVVSRPALTFAMRLARENRWDIEFAERCIDEYKRFLYLSARAPHAVTPSDAVDQVWHQHLVYTDNYWNELCKNILPGPLHHGPTRGGKTERIRYADQYEQTLEIYERYFGAPPSDIWPVATERFRQSAAAVRVDLGKNWIVPKPMSWMKLPANHRESMAAPILAIAFASVPLAALFPFNLSGGQFLVFYAVLSIAVFLAMAIAYCLVYSVGKPVKPDGSDSFGWGASAVLSGGKARLLQTSIATLVYRGQLKCGDRGFEVDQTKPFSAVDGDDEVATRTMFAIYMAASNQDKPRKMDHLRLYGMTEATRAEAQMHGLGIFKTPSQNFTFRSLQITLILGLFAIGGIRIAQGLSNDRPILLLAIEMGVVAMVTALVLKANNPLTPAGQRIWKQLRKLAEQKRTQSNNRGNIVDESAAPWVLAVFGAAAAGQYFSDATNLYAVDELYGREMLHRDAQKHRSNNDSSGGSGCGTTSGDVNSGGGDSGCGGACGGCGGGCGGG